MKPYLVVCDGMHPEIFSEFKKISQWDLHPKAKVDLDELEQVLPKAWGLVVRSATQVNASLLEKAPQLKLILRAGEGTDNIDKALCAQRGIKVSNTPGANNNSAAEHALALLFTVLRKTAWANSHLSSGGWDKSRWVGNELTGKKIGIVGYGRIGQILSKRLAGFEPQILFYDPFVEKGLFPYVRKAQDLCEIFSTCDIVTLHLPLISSTKGLIKRALLESMLPHSIFINASRGGLVDEEALYEILAQEKIRGAGLDVFATEPLEKESPLRKLPNLILTPHLGASTEEAQLRVGQMALEQMKEFFLNHQLINEVRA